MAHELVDSAADDDGVLSVLQDAQVALGREG